MSMNNLKRKGEIEMGNSPKYCKWDDLDGLEEEMWQMADQHSDLANPSPVKDFDLTYVSGQETPVKVYELRREELFPFETSQEERDLYNAEDFNLEKEKEKTNKQINNMLTYILPKEVVKHRKEKGLLIKIKP